MRPHVHSNQGLTVPGRLLMSQRDYGFDRSGVCCRGHCIYGAVSVTVWGHCLSRHSDGNPGKLQACMFLSQSLSCIVLRVVPAFLYIGSCTPAGL